MTALTLEQYKELFTNLLYCNMRELKMICVHFEIPNQGDKIQLIEHIITYLKTGKIPQVQPIPAISKAKPKQTYPLHPQTYILKGSFKNDLKTRLFLKTLIGNHFHYTAYGIDWIKDMWIKGTPPTYEQFAIYWQQEYKNRQKEKAPLKQEWAYLNFLDRYKNIYPQASKQQAIIAWKLEREKHVKKVEGILNFTF